MAKQPTIAERALILVRELYESSDAGSQPLRVLPTSPAAVAALEFALDNDWLVVEGEEYGSITLTATGRAVAKKGLS